MVTIDNSRTARLAADIGGTFTDLALEQDGRRYSVKVLTTPHAPEEGVLEGIARVLKIAGIGPSDVASFVHGTTLATNALIEKKGARTALITTEGFRDTIEIGRESRFDQYDIELEKPDPIVPRNLRFTLPERVNVDGTVHIPLDLAALPAIVQRLTEAQVESVAIGFLHSYANPAHEDQVAEALQRVMPRLYISKSSVVCPEIREYERFLTTCANAAVQPIIASYLRRLRSALDDMGLDCTMLLMSSGGGLTTLDKACEQPIRLVESGPAGGAILAAEIGRKIGVRELLSFDMGGTTAKICLIDDFQPTRSRTFEVARSKRFMKGSGMPIRIPVIEMVEIGAGGGSIARLDGMGRIRVGPDSAASDPGPSCYGLGGTFATVTDADVVMGKINPANFAGGRIQLNVALSIKAVSEQIAAPLGLSTEGAALGITEMVEEDMANATRVHAIERGKDLRRRTMVAFGGSAPLHAARLAEKLGVGRVVIPSSAGVGSAVGFLLAPIAYEVVRSRLQRLATFDAPSLNPMLEAMLAEGVGVVRLAAPSAKLLHHRSVYCRYVGQGHEIEIPIPDRTILASDAADLRSQFEAEYIRLFGRSISGADVEMLSWSIVVTADESTQSAATLVSDRVSAGDGSEYKTSALYDPALRKVIESPVYWRYHLAPGQVVAGPAIISENETSTIITSSFNAMIDQHGDILMTTKAEHTDER
jgi:N-methylhydantoinase A